METEVNFGVNWIKKNTFINFNWEWVIAHLSGNFCALGHNAPQLNSLKSHIKHLNDGDSKQLWLTLATEDSFIRWGGGGGEGVCGWAPCSLGDPCSTAYATTTVD